MSVLQQAQGAQSAFSVRRLRNLILICLVLGVALYTSAMFGLAENLARRLGPEVRVDLEWRVQRGAQELSRSADLALAVSDPALVRKAFGAYARSEDVQAIVAINAAGKLVAQHGSAPESTAALFSGEAGGLREGKGYLVSWANADIEGAPVGKLAVVVGLARLEHANALLKRSSDTSLVGGLAALVLGVLVVTFFTNAVAKRDLQLSDYAANLERKVARRTTELNERNRGMRLVLDNVAQGFITIGVDGVMAAERSTAVDRWFGTPQPGATLSAYLAEHAPGFDMWLDIGLEQLRDGFMPVALTLDQFPKRFAVGELTYDVAYTPLMNGDSVDRLLVIISDVTEHLAREHSQSEQKELVALFRRITLDRAGVEEFLTEAAGLVGALKEERDPVVQKRLVHTLKGNCAVYGLDSFAELAHAIETDLAENEGAALSDEQRSTLIATWKQTMQRVGWLLGTQRRDVIEIERSEYELLMARVRSGLGLGELVSEINDWRREPVERRLERLAQQASGLAVRLGKPVPTVEIQSNRVRLDSQGWAAFWAAMVHVTRNAVDHGIEPAEARVLAGKPAAGTLAFSALRQNGQMIISVRDDGRGIDWDKVCNRAIGMGLPHATQADLVDALFHDGLSTRDAVSATSGRGVGLGAVRQAVVELAGTLEVESVFGQGATWRFLFDESRAATAAHAVRRMVHSSLMPVPG